MVMQAIASSPAIVYKPFLKIDISQSYLIFVLA